MEKTDSYGGLNTPSMAATLVDASVSRVSHTLVSPVLATDLLAKKLLRRFFLAGTRPRYQRIADAWRDVARAYTHRHCNRRRRRSIPLQRRQKALLNGKRLRDGERIHVTFSSAYLPFVPEYRDAYARYRENQTVHVRHWRHAGRARPTAVCLHGWLGGHLPIEERVFAAPELYRAGLNVVFVVLPLHGPRRPAACWDGDLFPSTDLHRTNEAFGQAVTDVRTTLGGYGSRALRRG